jgi:uncharacterized protein YacL
MNAVVNPGGSPAEQPTKTLEPAAAGAGSSWSDKIKAIGGLAAVVVGVVVVGIIAIVAMAKDTSTASTIASATSGVIATIVGAYFGVKVGTDQGKTAMDNQKAEAAKAQVFAAHLPADQAKDVLELSKKAAQDVLGR